MGSGERKGEKIRQPGSPLFLEHTGQGPRKRLALPSIFARGGDSFQRALSLSAAAHLLAALVLFVPIMFGPSADIGGNREALARASASLAAERGSGPGGFRFTAEDIPDDLAPFLSLQTAGSGLLDREKFRFFKQLLRTYLEQNEGQEASEKSLSPDELIRALAGGGGFRLESGTRVFTFPSSSGPGFEIRALDPGRQRTVDFLKRARATKRDFFIEGQQVRIETDFGIQRVPSEYFFRSCPYEKMAALGPSLFHIIDGFPSFPGAEVPAALIPEGREEGGPLPRRLLSMPVRIVSGIPIEIFPAEAGPPSGERSGPPLIDEEGQRRILDDLMVFREREQLERFFEVHLKGLDPDSEEAAAFVRRFIYENLTNVFLFISDTSAAFDYLEELYYNRELKHTLLSLLQTYLDTRAGSEILMYFAAQYGFERRALQHLYDTYAQARKDLKGKYFKAEVHEKKAKLYVITRIYEDLQRVLRPMGLDSLEAVVNLYRTEEAKIYSLLIDRGGPDGYQGLFALGRLYWKNQLHDLAFAAWDLIPLDHPLETLAEIRDVIGSAAEVERVFPMIGAILDYHANRNVREHLARLVKFGKWAKRAD